MRTGGSGSLGHSDDFNPLMSPLRLARLALFSISFIGVLFWGRSAQAGILGNPGFEIGIGDSAVNWDNTNGATRITSPPAGFDAFPEGSSALLLDAASDYTFQTVKGGVQPGDLVVLSAQVESGVALDGTSGGQLRI